MRLVNAIGKCYSKQMNREINPLNEILVTVGAYGSLFNALNTFLEKDDEV
jgi:kynurenine---oxoglutarate transaminase / cysteine-S-conjugate beta-lyase / glutamine---phenylpyruvate transaminase